MIKGRLDYLIDEMGFVTVVKAGGQYQVVIGNHVPDVYRRTVLKSLLVFLEGSVEADDDAVEENLSDLHIALVSGSFSRC